MKIEINIAKICQNDKCRHEAFKESCLVCMVSFAINHIDEIKQDGLEKTVQKYKEGGYFI